MTNAEYLKQWKANRTKEQKEIQRLKNAAYMRNKRANMSEEEVVNEKKQKSEAAKKRRANLTEEQIKKKSEQNRKSYLKHKEKIVQKIKDKFHNNPSYRVIHSARTRTRRILKGIEKAAHTIDLIGCSQSELKAYLERQFDSKMNWENYGSYWHVDHIKPCSSFDLSKQEEQFKCFHYSNLRPLEAKENLRKGNRY